ncbi:hypothetical protein ERO13_A13G029000v2 [Gossypium hirsutum]|uniref:Embryo surrounding factor 1 brassicaceae domain-containing protein n=5 Tax=Gossypium TaxID=3633 RepID=A0A2P5WGB7_GOSBA|nr:EMBRYO SURROUNDING FACTOR 1.3-like [Gossypium hirsutum]KAB2047226.1 hypothetical protein ES319_A13G030300v1 [Gossypium barbadense]TYG85132.1 hypothetical protein ES288_A13G028400v1 [Gossypium darwinii]TYH90169.1 hypothetical protein ES332_A13G031600v1 [Gossypium tomentosum]TYI99617.1 hypothetical protein E1A91_A13G029600v1 [Gossypium mustelinum]KAG4164632.1 hypothetical protein ERO13_A13G029000v2 [Gossypium hirsutum]
MTVHLAFLFLVFASLVALHECTSDDELDRSIPTGNEIILGPCSHSTCRVESASENDSIFRNCWCCLSLKSHLCYTYRIVCENNCPPGPPPDLAIP